MECYDNLRIQINEIITLLSLAQHEAALSEIITSNHQDTSVFDDTQETLPDTIHHATRRPNFNNTITKSCMILGVSYFEGFLKDLIDESFDKIITARSTYSDLPTTLRGYALKEGVAYLKSTNNDPIKHWDIIADLFTKADIYKSRNIIDNSMLPREEVKRELTSIDPKNINKIFKIMGEDNINDNSPIKGTKTVNLKNIKQLRDDLSHGNNSSAQLTHQEVREHLDTILEVSQEIDMYMETLIIERCTARE